MPGPGGLGGCGGGGGRGGAVRAAGEQRGGGGAAAVPGGDALGPAAVSARPRSARRLRSGPQLHGELWSRGCLPKL